MTRRQAEAAALAVVGVLFVVAAWARLRALLATPFPTGVDGYWYLIEVRSLLERGRLHYPSAPLVPWLMAAAALVLEPVLALKSVAAVGSAALVWPSYWIGKRISGSVGPALLGAALAATSAQSSFLATEFVTQAVGLSLALGFVAALAAALERPGARRLGLALALYVLCALTHKTALGLASLFAAPPVIAHLWRTRGLRVALTAAAAIAAGALVFLGIAGRAPLRQLLRGTADGSFAVLATPGRPSLVLGYEVALAAGLAALALGLAFARKPAQGPRLPALAVGLFAFAIGQALPWIDISDDQGLGYRLRLCACVCLAPAAALVAARLSAWLLPVLRPILLGGATLLVLLLRPWHSDEGVIKAHPAMVEATSRLAAVVPPGTFVVIPERHTAFMAAWYARLDVHLRPPAASDPTKTFRLLPGAAIRPGLWAALDDLRARPVAGVAPPPALHPLHPNGLVLLPEPTFQYLVARLPAAERLWYETWVVQ
jgi:ABC-type amino acid transport substrate-binding protein